MNKLHKKLKMSIYGRLKTRMKCYEVASNDQIIYQKGHFLLFTIYRTSIKAQNRIKFKYESN